MNYGNGGLDINKPLFHDYELLGDSQLCRFAVQILNEKTQFIYNKSKVGFCIGGQIIEQLTNEVKNHINKIYDRDK